MFPDVPVRVYIRDEDPAHALGRAIRGAERLLILRTSRGGLAHHLGRTARAVLRDGHCPVEVVPARRAQYPRRRGYSSVPPSWSRDRAI